MNKTAEGNGRNRELFQSLCTLNFHLKYQCGDHENAPLRSAAVGTANGEPQARSPLDPQLCVCQRQASYGTLSANDSAKQITYFSPISVECQKALVDRFGS